MSVLAFPGPAEEVLATMALPGGVRVTLYLRPDKRFSWVATKLGQWATAGSGATRAEAEAQVAAELSKRFAEARTAMLLAWDALVQSGADLDDLGDEVTATTNGMVHLMALRRG